MKRDNAFKKQYIDYLIRHLKNHYNDNNIQKTIKMITHKKLLK
jgi:hypothetical protein